MKGKSVPKTPSRTSSCVSFTMDTVANTPLQSRSNSSLSIPLTNSPQLLSFERVVENCFNKNLRAFLTSKNSVLKEVRDCIKRDEEDRLKQLNPYLHSYWRDLHVSTGFVPRMRRCPSPMHVRKPSSKTYMQVTRAAGEWFVWPNIAGGHTWIAISLVKPLNQWYLLSNINPVNLVLSLIKKYK